MGLAEVVGSPYRESAIHPSFEECAMSASKTVKRVRPPKPARRAWARPDFRDYDTPMEVTAYAARA